MYDLRRLRSLCAIADHGSLTGAAAALDFTQPAVSQHLAALEAEVGAPLVTRSRGGAELTAAGALLVEHARAALDRLALAELQVADLVEREQRRVRLAANSSALTRLVPLAVADLRRRAARRRGHDHASAGRRRRSPSCARGDVDLAVAFRRERPAPRPRASTSARCSRSRCTPSSRARHPLARRRRDRARRPARRPLGPGPVRDLARPDPRALPRRGLRAADRVRERRPARHPRHRRRRAGREPGPVADQGRHGARPQRRRAAAARPAAPPRGRAHRGRRPADRRRRARWSSRSRAPAPGSAGAPSSLPGHGGGADRRQGDRAGRARGGQARRRRLGRAGPRAARARHRARGRRPRLGALRRQQAEGVGRGRHPGLRPPPAPGRRARGGRRDPQGARRRPARVRHPAPAPDAAAGRRRGPGGA